MEKSMMNADMYSPLNLAYIGDAVYELFVREKIVIGRNMPVVKFHRKTIAVVSAKSQALSIESIKDRLTEKELEVYKWGKNAKSKSSAKNASIVDYHKATGFETLIGYLYVNGDMERLKEVEEMAFAALEETNGRI